MQHELCRDFETLQLDFLGGQTPQVGVVLILSKSLFRRRGWRDLIEVGKTIGPQVMDIQTGLCATEVCAQL